jgi:hypothetical protein
MATATPTGLTMRPAELSALLSKTIPARLPVLIKGAPGVGKTDIVTAAAEAAGANLVLMHPVVSDPTDFKGLPAVVGGKADFLPFGELSALMSAKTDTVAFLDDLGQAPAVVQAAAMQLILARQINGHKISDKVVFCAATNRREDKAGVTSILEPVKSRFATIVELAVNLDDWSKWALAHNVPPEVVAFCRFRPNLFAEPGAPTNDIVNRPCPRTITHLAKLYSIGIRELAPLAGAAGQGFATEFVGFIRIWQSLPSIDGILTAPDKAPVPEEPAALYAVATALAVRATAENAGRIIKYATRLPDEFGVLCVKDMLHRCPAAANNREFIKWGADKSELLC